MEPNDDLIRTLEKAGDGPADPLSLFDRWMEDAVRTEINDPNAMCLATVDADGQPSARMVLLKQLDDRGFVFFTNRESRKGLALAAHPVAALCFHWKSLGRSVRVEGSVTEIDDSESDAYYASRSEGSRIGAWASQQSRPLKSRSLLKARVQALEEDFKAQPNIPRPPHWGGYRVQPKYIEFWHDGAFRLHTRLAYKSTGKEWIRDMLYP